MTTEMTRQGAVVITGGSGDIGFALCRRLVAEGRRVALWDVVPRRDEEWAAVADQTLYCPCDVREEDAIASALARTHERFGPVSALVNAVGVGHHSDFSSLSADQWNRIVEINLCGPVNAIRAVLPDMRARGDGVVVNVCSIWSRASGTNRTAYIASKWGLLGATNALAAELAPQGIRVCAVSPGLVDTGMSRGLADPQARSRWMTADSVAEVLAFAISGAAAGLVGGEVQLYGWVRPPGLG